MKNRLAIIYTTLVTISMLKDLAAEFISEAAIVIFWMILSCYSSNKATEKTMEILQM